MESDKQMMQRLREELKRSEEAKKRNAETAKRSFENWMDKTVPMVGRAVGYHLKIAKKKFGELYDWLFS